MLSKLKNILPIPKPDMILYVILLFFVSFFIWASRAELEEVTRGNGKIIASSKVQVIQNLEGGIINEIAVKTGQRVKENDLLVKLDETQFLGDLNSANQQLTSLEQSLELLEEERLILEPLVDAKVEPRINLIRLLQRISTAQSEYQATLDQIPNLQDKLKRTSVRAPMDGIINRILNNTTGGVVQAASPILEIIPLNDELIIEVEVSPTDIAYVIKGQKAIVQLSAFDFAIYGSLSGEVLNVSPDTVTKDDGSTWYVCLVSIPADGVTSMSRELQLLPGMQATVNIVSGSKTILSYLMQPVTNIKNKAFRER
ncbi:HlyD family efflux transporter periplasmic adaptor subunit [Gammaproteobacteria bacterium]|nr:HlyD family efflux transporter periplasmic adaptor subunit [Gammaproteobacteria bacterium]MDC0591065.1 HlyD family efflux transporter periplasmic adaptor subunit [Gammaproteobacteria bacterium]|tara:strand:+ start:511 stop:1449 length:939 start_codon:yes stop_codon:yes gene_type:complete